MSQQEQGFKTSIDLLTLGRMLGQSPKEHFPPIVIQGKEISVNNPRLREILILVMEKGQTGFSKEEIHEIEERYSNPRQNPETKDVQRDTDSDISRLNRMLMEEEIDLIIKNRFNNGGASEAVSGNIFIGTRSKPDKPKDKPQPKKEAVITKEISETIQTKPISIPKPTKTRVGKRSRIKAYSPMAAENPINRAVQHTFLLERVPSEPEKDPQAQLINNVTTRALYEIANSSNFELKMLKENLGRVARYAMPKGFVLEAIFENQNPREFIAKGVTARLEELWKKLPTDSSQRDLYDLGLKNKVLKADEETTAKQVFALLFTEDFQYRFIGRSTSSPAPGFPKVPTHS